MRDYYQEILDLKGQEVEYEPSGFGHIKMKKHNFPFSIKKKEFNFLIDLITKYNLKSGFEMGTGVGIGTTALGIGFKNTGGKLVTLDSYIEEHLESYGAYEHMDPKNIYNSDGYKSIKFLINHFDLNHHVFPEIGWAPNDMISSITKNIKSKLDFVFFDSGHFPHQLIKEIEEIEPLLDENYVIVFHDHHPDFFNENVMSVIKKVFKKDLKIAVPRPEGEDMAVIINMDKDIFKF